MMDALRQNDSFTRYRRDLARRINDATHTLTLMLGRPPEPEEVAGRLDMDIDSYWQAMDSIMPVSHVSMDATTDSSTGEDVGRSLAETLMGDDGVPLPGLLSGHLPSLSGPVGGGGMPVGLDGARRRAQSSS